MVLLFAIMMNMQTEAQVAKDSTAADSMMLKQVEEMMKSSQPVAPVQTRSGISANPDIGVIGDFQGSYISSGKKNIDAYLNETEISFQAVVDPYIRADFFVSFGRDPVTGDRSDHAGRNQPRAISDRAALGSAQSAATV